MAKKEVKASVAKTPGTQAKKRTVKVPKFLKSFGGYFRGAWVELRQVRWPDRKATWSLTLAVILFSVFFALIIVGLDAAFNYLFREVLL